MFYFAEQLKGVEDSGFDIASSMREMILSFDPTKEIGQIRVVRRCPQPCTRGTRRPKKNPRSKRDRRKSGHNAAARDPKTDRQKNYKQAESDLKTLACKESGRGTYLLQHRTRRELLQAEQLPRTNRKRSCSKPKTRTRTSFASRRRNGRSGAPSLISTLLSRKIYRVLRRQYLRDGRLRCRYKARQCIRRSVQRSLLRSSDC